MSTGKQHYDDIIVAIHGIGDQMRNATVRDVATRFARMPSLAKGGVFVAPQPLGYFHTDVTDAAKVSPLGSVPECPLSKMGFSEVYWADIPEVVVNEGHTMDETKAWARTIVSRVRAAYFRTKHDLDSAKALKLPAADRLQLAEPDFTLASEVLEEIIDTINVLENLFFLARKAGIADFELGRMLQQYVGDVQIFTEFKLFRCKIIARFHDAMAQIHNENPGARLHIVAHSEGTVVSFLGLLYALSGTRMSATAGQREAIADPLQGAPAWASAVAGYFTIGSPIDKHLLLWPELFNHFDFSGMPPLANGKKIEWRNYYDYGDPVGFKLDTARRWLSDVHCEHFNFKQDRATNHDIGYARYMLPGKAHTDYFADRAVFEHLVRDVIVRVGPPVVPPRTRPVVYIVSPLIPYFLSFAILFSASLLLHRAVSQFLHPPLEAIQSYALWTNLGTLPAPDLPRWQLYRESLGLTLLYAGTTLLARWPRLAKGFVWWLAGTGGFMIGCVGYVSLLSRPSREAIGALFKGLGGDVTYWTLLAAFLVALIGLTGVSKPDSEEVDFDTSKETPTSKSRAVAAAAKVAKIVFHTRVSRKSRWFSKRMRPLMLCGVALISGIIFSQIRNPAPILSNDDRSDIIEKYVRRSRLEYRRGHGSEPTPDTVKAIREEGTDRARQFATMVQTHPPIWPVMLAGAAFLYLWWLAALIFDLGFVWQRYVRQSFTLNRLEQWRQIRIQCQLVPNRSDL